MAQLGQSGDYYYQSFPKADGGFNYVRTVGGYIPENVGYNPGSTNLTDNISTAQLQPFSIGLADIPKFSAAPAGGTSTAKPLNTGAVDNTNLAINQIAPILAQALASEGTSFDNTKSLYDANQKQQQGQYDTSTVTNQQNYDSNFMDSIRAGIHGLGGLINILRGTGAAGGTAENQVRDVVGGVTSNDIRTGADTQKANQTTLDSALSTFLTDLKGKRQLAEDTHTNNIRAIQGNADTQLQDLYGKLAGYYGDAGDTASANRYMAQAGTYTPSIAANTVKATSPYDTTPIPVQAPQLTAFAAPSQPNAISAPQDGQVGSGIFTITKPKKASDQTFAPALAGA